MSKQLTPAGRSSDRHLPNVTGTGCTATLAKRTALLTAVAALMLLGRADGAAATDLGPEPVFEGSHDLWTGPYIGASLGYGWGQSETTYDRNDGNHDEALSRDTSGVLGALTLGYNYRLNGNIVLGVEGDLGFMDVGADDQTGLWDGHVWKGGYGGLWGTVRARAGWTLGNSLLYGTGGLAFMETNETILGDNDATQNTYNEGMHTGWVLGGGLEYALSKNISAKLEYLHMEFPEYSGYTNNQEPYSFDNSIDIARVGVNYRF